MTLALFANAIHSLLFPLYFFGTMFSIFLDLIDVNNPPTIGLGFYHDSKGVITNKSFEINYNFTEKGSVTLIR